MYLLLTATVVLGPLYSTSQGQKNQAPTLSIFELQIGPKLLINARTLMSQYKKCWNIGPRGCKLASQIWWYPFSAFEPIQGPVFLALTPSVTQPSKYSVLICNHKGTVPGSLGSKTWWLGAHTKRPLATWGLGHEDLRPYIRHAEGLQIKRIFWCLPQA